MTQTILNQKNRELEELYNQPDIVKIIQSERIRWGGHVKRQSVKRVIKLEWCGKGIQMVSCCWEDLGCDARQN